MDNHGQDHKEVTIIVNTREKTWDKKQISYQEVVILAFGSYSNDENVVYTVTYSRGEKSHHEGSLVKGESVNVKDGMIFNVSQSNKS
ncbi:MAG: multiubiquitin domain-containing protein [Acidobacteriia bacterium]|nr:multiubiquitin domain-containing protein [Terriglobia bacterium]